MEAEGRLNLWQIAIKPGKPLAFGEVRRAGRDDAAFFIGLPGNPVSSFVTFLLFVRPFLLRLQGVTRRGAAGVSRCAPISTGRKPTGATNSCVRRINAHGGLDLFPNQSSAVLTSTVWGDGLVDNPPGKAIAAATSCASCRLPNCLRTSHEGIQLRYFACDARGARQRRRKLDVAAATASCALVGAVRACLRAAAAHGPQSLARGGRGAHGAEQPRR